MSSSSQFRSVLDSGSRDLGGKVHIDRLTRHRSPSRPRDDEDEEVIVPRLPQPYRTSLSAVVAPVRVRKSERSRSVSPGSSLASFGGRSRSKSPGQRRTSPKHVTYDERVTVRHSDTEDSIVTNLSGKDSSLERSPQQTASLKADMEYLSVSPGAMSQDSTDSYSAQLRQTSGQMLESHSLTPSPREYTGSPPQSGVIKDTLQVSPSMLSPGSSSGASPIQSSPGKGDSGVYTDGESSSRQGKVNIEKSYTHDRTTSYRQAIQKNYSEEVRRLAEANIEEFCPRDRVAGRHPRSPVSPSSEFCPRTERSNTMPTNTAVSSDKNLTVSKKSVGSSIGSFFRKISPRMSRREGKRASSRSSTSGSAQSLDVSTGDSAESNQSNDGFTRSSRSKGRRSFLKLIGGSRSKSRSKSEQEEHSSTSKSPKSPKHREIPNEHTSPQGQQFPNSTNIILKNIEQNAIAEKNIYQKFKEKQTTPGRSGEKTLAVKSHALKATATPTYTMVQNGTQMNKENALTFNESSNVASTPAVVAPEGEGGKADPPRTLNVRPLTKSLHSPFVSAASVDDSIGDCSLDINMEGGEPSLLTTNGHTSVSGSKQVILSQDNLLEFCPNQSQNTQKFPPHVESSRPGDGCTVRDIVAPMSSGGMMHLSQTAPVIRLENGPLSGYSSTSSDIPQLSDSNSCEISPRDYKRMPSYLKLSCAVSGYGQYSSYSSRKNIEIRSHDASTSSLKSDGSSLSETSGLLIGTGNRTSSLPLQVDRKLAEIKHIGHVNGHLTDYVPNGHTGVHPTGDQVKDGQYFLDVCQTEEDRLLILCARAQDDMVPGTLPEEANGRIRAAIGKTNLVITKKFKQFRGLCHKYMKPDSADRPTMWEDLQGFWDMVKIQIDDLDELFAEIAFMRQNEWKDVPRKIQSARSSANSSAKSPSLSLSSTPSVTPGHTPGHTPASRRKPLNVKDTPDSSPEKSQKAKQTAKAREDARKKMLAEKRATMKQKKIEEQQNNVVEIFFTDSKK